MKLSRFANLIPPFLAGLIGGASIFLLILSFLNTPGQELNQLFESPQDPSLPSAALPSAPADIEEEQFDIDSELPSEVAITSWRNAVKRSIPAVVSIRAKHELSTGRSVFGPSLLDRIFGSPRRSQQAIREGSGVHLGGGNIITNHHVVRNLVQQPKSLVVEFVNGQRAYARVIGQDPGTDLALLRMEDMDQLPMSIAVGNTDDLEVGDPVAAIGNPFGVGLTVTQGIISATSRNAGNPYLNLLQTDAAINPGNSGGALIDTQGRLIGISTSILSRSGDDSGVSFAIPIDIVLRIVDELLTHGEVQIGWLGIGYYEHIALRSAGGNLIRGVRLRAIYDDSPLAQAGFHADDILIEIDGMAANPSNLRARLSTLHTGDQVRLLFIRNDDVHAATVTAGTRPATTN